MSEPLYPNESEDYRTARELLLEQEAALVDQVKAVADLRRKLPLGGRVEQDYPFTWAVADKLGQSVNFSELFAGKQTLMLYNFMFGPSWDKPCPSCTSLMDGFDRVAYSVSQDAAFVGIAKAPAEMVHSWATARGWSQIPLVSGFESSYLADYRCQGEEADQQYPMMQVFRREGDEIYHFWGSELQGNHVDTVWAYWNLMDLTPEGRPDVFTPPQDFRSRYLEDHYLS